MNVLEIWQEWGQHLTIRLASQTQNLDITRQLRSGTPIKPVRYRTPMEIIQEDLRKTAAKFRAADMSHRLDPDQARRLDIGTSLTIWNDLVARRLYAGQHVPLEKLIRLTVPRHEMSINHDGVRLGGVRHLFSDLIQCGILERARDQAISALNSFSQDRWQQEPKSKTAIDHEVP